MALRSLHSILVLSTQYKRKLTSTVIITGTGLPSFMRWLELVFANRSRALLIQPHAERTHNARVLRIALRIDDQTRSGRQPWYLALRASSENSASTLFRATGRRNSAANVIQTAARTSSCGRARIHRRCQNPFRRQCLIRSEPCPAAARLTFAEAVNAHIRQGWIVMEGDVLLHIDGGFHRELG